MIPTADDVASVIVAACRETCEDPLTCYTPQIGIHARQYAYQALAVVFDHDRKGIARMVGCTGNPQSFVTTVKHNLARHPRRPRRAAWWNDGGFDRVTAVARERLSLRRTCGTCGESFLSAEAFRDHECDDPLEPALPPQPITIRPAVERVARAQQAPERPAAEPPPRPAPSAPAAPPAPPRRRGYDMLAEAVRNTQRQTPPPED